MIRLLCTLFFFIPVFIVNLKSFAASTPIELDNRIQFGFFSSTLAPYGEWIEVESGIRVWHPSHIPHLWRPYLLGQWLWTDDGWYWLSEEPFGWITYHYGRWYCDDYYGWIWVPDDVWAPAWVEWRYDDDYIGWAPLPPYATFQRTVGIRFTAQWIAPAHYWNFVRYHRFGSVIRFRDTAPLGYAKHLIRTNRRSIEYGIDHERIINHGVDRTIIERLGNVRFNSTAVRETREFSGERLSRSTDDPQSRHIEVCRPARDEMQNSTDRIEARRGERNLSMDVTKFEQPRIESTMRSDMRPSMNKKINEGLPSPFGFQGGRQQERLIRERIPHMQQRPSQPDRQKMRRELIQRHELKQKLSPPIVRDGSRQQIERRREYSRIGQPHSSLHGRRRENRNLQ